LDLSYLSIEIEPFGTEGLARYYLIQRTE
jgi:hypothetical protein